MPAVVPEADPQPHSELASFGEELRREREIRGISLKEIADATKISKRFLDAIEHNDHKTLPAPVFTRGFVREYARYLGLNAEDMVNRYNYAAAGDDRIEKNAHLERLVAPKVAETAPSPRPKQGIPPPYARVDRNIYILVIVIAALAGAIWFAVSHKRQTQEQPLKPIAAPAVAKPAKQQIAQTSTAPATAAAAQDETLHLVLDLSDDSVVKLYADGQKVFDGKMRNGDHRTFDAKREFRFATIGNAGGLAATLNGVAIPAFGGAGQVRHDKILNRETLREVPADAERSRP
jgi:transcriptional regulator with XRE-family HTH domain